MPGHVETREYQQRVINNTAKAIADGHKHILIESPTGSGKTIIALLLAKLLREKYGWRAGWTAMRRHLLIQAAAENQDKVGEDIHFFSTFGEIPEGKGIDILFEDEGHHSVTASSTEVSKKLEPKCHIALTATPFRTDRMKLCFSKVIKDAGLRALIDQGYLSPYHQYIVRSEWTPAVVAKLYCDDPKRWGKSVGYFLTEAECIECAEIIRSNGHKVEIVTGSSNQEEQIHEFNHSEDLNLLLNMVVLTEGFDSPILKTVFIRPGSKGPTIQMGGRAFRRHPQKPYCNVVQCDQAWWPFTKIASAERKFLMEQGGHWESREVNEKVEQAQRASILAIAKVTISMPESLKKFQGKKNYFAAQKALSE